MNIELACTWVCIVSWISTGILHMVILTIAIPKGCKVGRRQNVKFYDEVIREERDPVKRARYTLLLLLFNIAGVTAFVSLILLIVLQVNPRFLAKLQ